MIERWFKGSAYFACAILLHSAAPNSAMAQAPQRTTATYEDWTVRCETRVEPPNLKTCEMVQSTQVQGQPGPVTQIAIGRAAKAEPLKIIFQVPINVWLPAGVKFTSAEKEAPLASPFKRCVPAACLADSDLKDDLVRKLRTAPRTASSNSRMRRNVTSRSRCRSKASRRHSTP